MKKFTPYSKPAALTYNKEEEETSTLKSTDPALAIQQSKEIEQPKKIENKVKMATINIDPLKLVKNLPNFNGKSCNIIIFIKKVDFIINVVNLYNEAAKEFIVNEIKSKITENALEVVLRGGDPNNWQEIKKLLVKNFGEKESFLKLKELADKVYTKNITQLYNSYADILCRLNNKYYLSEDKPIEYNCSNNEASLLAKFCEKIPPNASSIIINHEIKTLSEAFYKLESCHWTKEESNNNNERNIRSYRTGNNYNNFNDKNYKKYNNYNTNQRNDRNYKNESGNSNNYRNFNNKGQNFYSRNNNQNYRNQNEQNYRQPNRSGNYSNNNRNPFATQNKKNDPEPMEVDHLTQNTANFQTPASTDHYPA